MRRDPTNDAPWLNTLLGISPQNLRTVLTRLLDDDREPRDLSGALRRLIEAVIDEATPAHGRLNQDRVEAFLAAEPWWRGLGVTQFAREETPWVAVYGFSRPAAVAFAAWERSQKDFV